MAFAPWQELAKKAQASMKLQRDALAVKRKELAAMQKVWMAEEIKRRTDAGEQLGFKDSMNIMKETVGRMTRELVAERQRLSGLHGNIYDQQKKALGVRAERLHWGVA